MPKERQEFASLLADDAVFVDAHGPAGKAEVVKNTADFRLDKFSVKVYTAALWVEPEDKWLCLFSQETYGR